MKQFKTFLIDLGNSNLEYYELNNDHNLINHQYIETQLVTQQILNERFSNSVCIISSVVPKLDTLFVKVPNTTIRFIDHSSISDLNINIKNISELGADRIITSYAAYKTYKRPCLIIDSGTALTFCFIDKLGTYQGGVIFPGLKISSKALNNHTAKIPLIFVNSTNEIIGKTTKEAVEVGLFHGFRYLINGFINDYRQKYPDILVVATGSAISVLEPFIDVDIVEPQLIFLGLKQVYIESSF